MTCWRSERDSNVRYSQRYRTYPTRRAPPIDRNVWTDVGAKNILQKKLSVNSVTHICLWRREWSPGCCYPGDFVAFQNPDKCWRSRHDSNMRLRFRKPCTIGTDKQSLSVNCISRSITQPFPRHELGLDGTTTPGRRCRATRRDHKRSRLPDKRAK